MTLISQNIKDLKWKKRVVIIYADSFENAQAQEQVVLLKSKEQFFKEYRLTVLEYTNEGSCRDFGKVEETSLNDNIKNFKVRLIGLDGGLKFESSTVQPAKTFFDLIDTMPMRQSELRNKGE